MYTTAGVELARVTVINSDLKTVYESLVRPEHKIIDYNTRFSGITRQQMRGVRTALRDVQAVLLSMFSERTILIGHSLESDFIALKVRLCSRRLNVRNYAQRWLELWPEINCSYIHTYKVARWCNG